MITPSTNSTRWSRKNPPSANWRYSKRLHLRVFTSVSASVMAASTTILDSHRVPRRLHFLRVEDEVRALRFFGQPVFSVVTDRAFDVAGGIGADGGELRRVLPA